MINAKADGKTITFTAGEALSSGDLVTVGNLVAVVSDDAANAATDAVGWTEGVFELPKDASTFAQGDPCYSVPVGDGQITASVSSTATASQFVGYCWTAAATGVGVVQVKIQPGGKDVLG